MGKGSKKQTVGYKYYIGQHLIFCHGPIDYISHAKVDERIAWQGKSTGGAIVVNAPSLFGGDGREGGVSGTIDIEMGSPTQLQNSYLVSQLGDDIPAYRGVVGAVFRQCYLGNNPYLKKWSFRGTRVLKTTDGATQWYSAKAGINGRGFSVAEWKYKILDVGSNDPAPAALDYDDSDWAVGVAPFRGPTSTGTPIPGNKRTAWFRKIVPQNFQTFTATFDDVGYLYFNGVFIQQFNIGTHTITLPHANGGLIAFRVVDTIGVQFLFSPVIEGGDMNGAHIIRECLTDSGWGMGYLAADIDDTFFMAAADQIYNEGLGISLLWDKQIPLEDFVDEIVKHIDAAVYVSRTTGKYVMKLIRDDYDPETLLHLDESTIDRIEDPKRASFGELINSVTVNYWDSLTGKDASLTVTDTAMVQQQGAVINTTVQYPGFTNPRSATIAGQRDLRSLSSPFLSCTIYADSTANDLNLGDAFKLSWTKWGLVEVIMRVTGISFGNGRKRQVRIECSQDTFRTDTNVVITVPDSDWEDPGGPPGIPDLALADEAPYYELAQLLGDTEAESRLAAGPDIGYIFASSSRPSSAINARIWTDSGDGYEDVGVLDFAPSALLRYDITKIQTEIEVVALTDAEEIILGTHFQIGSELLRIDAVDTVNNLLTVGRGILDTVPQEHAAGTPMLFWDQYAGFDGTEYVAGETVDVKITPISGAGVVDISEVAPITVTLNQRAVRPYAPGNFRVEGELYGEGPYFGDVEITWAHRDRTQQTGGTLYDHTFGDIGPEIGTEYRLVMYVDDVLDQTFEPAVSGGPFDPSSGREGTVRVELDSVRDMLYSWQKISHEFVYLQSAARVLDDDSGYRAAEDGSIRPTEG